jgi:tetratricopeptide (TPR) repeat protein
MMLESIRNALDLGFGMEALAHIDALLADPRPLAWVQATRALHQLGDVRGSNAMVLRRSRGRLDDHDVYLACLRVQVGWRPHLGIEWMSRRVFPPNASAEHRAEYLACQASIAAMLRDFALAAERIQQALALAPESAWIHVEQAWVLSRDDRSADALAAVERALALRPGYRAALQARVQLLLTLGRRDEAIEILERESSQRTSAALTGQLFALQIDERRHAEAGETLERLAVLSPRADRDQRRWFSARRCDVAMALGRLDEALVHAAALPATYDFYRRLSERLQKRPPGAPRSDRRLLDVPFVAQHWATCAPATLASIAAYWNVNVDHLEISEQICYDGTPAHSQRAWAITQGLHVREFRVDESCAHALIDAGVPFALVTVQPGASHLQAVAGYDRIRGSLLIRDPSLPVYVEYALQPLLESHRAHGPRAMVVLPKSESHRLQDIVLPDAELWDLYDEVQASLARHDRAGASRAFERLHVEDRAGRLSTRARHSLAIYDDDQSAALALADRLLELDPDDVNLQLGRSAALWRAGNRDVHLAWFDQLAARSAVHPLLLIEWAERLAEDHRRLPQAMVLARRAWRKAPLEGRIWGLVAMLRWQADRRDDALPLYRAGSTLQPTAEGAAIAYFRACAMLGRTEEGLAMLRERVRRLGAASGAPAMTLFDRLDVLERVQEGFEVLDQAVTRRPADADLRLFIAEAHLRYGDLPACETHLRAIDQPARAASVMRLRARLAERQLDFDAAWRLAREGCVLDPFDLDLRRLVMKSLAAREGRTAAVAWLQQACDEYPQRRDLQHLLYEWLPDEASAINACLARMAANFPDDPWLMRERAVQAGRQGRLEDAFRFASEALQRNPEDDRSHSTMGFAVLRRDGYAQAEAYFWAALKRNPDNDYAMARLVDSQHDAGRTVPVLRRILDVLLAAPLTGHGIVEFQRLAAPILDAEELEVALRRFWTERPDVWQTWLALAVQLQRSGGEDRALALLKDGVARFPMLPRMHLELARSLQLAGLRDEARAALAPALQIAPALNPAVRLYVDLVEPQDLAAESAMRVLRRAVVIAPEDADLRGLLAWLMNRAGDQDGALAVARESVLADPSASWVWNLVHTISRRREAPALFDDLVDLVESSRPGDPWSWLVRARHGQDDLAGLAAAEEALRLDPRLTSAWKARLERLQKLGRHDEVLALVSDLPWPDSAPPELLAYGPRSQWAQGRRADAVSGLSAVLEASPHDFDLWRMLADWQDDCGQHEHYLRAAREMMRIAPNDVLSLAYVGHALLKSGDADSAIEPLQLALRREPGYRFALRQLAEAARKTGRHALFDEMAESAWVAQQDTETARDGVLAACQARAQPRAAQWWRRLIEIDGAVEVKPVEDAAQALVDADWGSEIDRSVPLALVARRCATRAGLIWLQRQERRRGGLYCRLKLLRLHWHGANVPLAQTTMKWLVARRELRLLRWYVRYYERLLRTDPTTWGEVSYNLLQFPRQQRAVVRWLRDWRQRSDAPVWALGNLSLSLAALDRWPEAETVAQQVLTRVPDNEDARLWVLSGAAIRNDLQAVQAALERLHEWKPDAWMSYPLELIKAWAACERERTLEPARRAFAISRENGSDVPASKRLRKRLGRQLVLRHGPWWRLPLDWFALAW